MLGTALLLVLVSCTGAEETAPRGGRTEAAQPTSPGATIEARPLPLSVRVTRVWGRLAKPRQAAVVRGVGRSISAYFDAGFLGEYPRTDFENAFSSFTRGMVPDARRDQDLLTNAVLGEQTESVTTRAKQARLSVLSPNGFPAGVTARVRLVYVADRGDAGSTRVTTSGRLLLTRQRSGWKIFGYDVARSAVPVEKGSSQ